MSFLGRLSKLKEKTLDLLFPAKCIDCGRDGQYICQTCRKSLKSIDNPICEYCGMPVGQGNLCEVCQQHPSDIDGIRSVYVFDGIARHAVHQLKYNNLKAISVAMAKMLRDRLVTIDMPFDVLVPVPLHSSRLRERGYNQATKEELAQATDSSMLIEKLSIKIKLTEGNERNIKITSDRDLQLAESLLCEAE